MIKFHLLVTENDKIVCDNVIECRNMRSQRAVKAFNTRTMRRAYRLYPNANNYDIKVIYG